MSLPNELTYVVAAAIEAGDAALGYFESGDMGTRAKGSRDVVTLADTAAERILTARLRDAFPRDGIVGEEGTGIPSSGTRTWYVDPVDGTLNFSRSIPVWCVSVALFDGSVPTLGVVHDPIRRETFTVAPGSDAVCNDAPMSVSGVASLSDALVNLTVDFRSATMASGLRDLQAVAPRVLRTRNVGSATLALAWVAAGRFDAMLHRFAHPWDYGAGVALIEAAGGRVTDLSGNRYSVSTRSVVATNGRVHDALLDILRDGPA